MLVENLGVYLITLKTGKFRLGYRPHPRDETDKTVNSREFAFFVRLGGPG